MKERIEKKRLAILRVLRSADKPLSSSTITDELYTMGYDMSPRTIRFHLKSMDTEGLTQYSEKHGRFITPKGIQELELSRVFEKVGFLNALIDEMSYKMDFNISEQEGNIIVNISYIKKKDIKRAAELLLPAFSTGFSMGQLVRLYSGGEHLCSQVVPDDCIGLGTVCSFTLNGILTRAGIPVNSRFGGLLQIEGGEPIRFIEIINYDGTSIDPLEIFIQSRMTKFPKTGGNNNGRIGANFFEFPEGARGEAVRIIGKMRKIGLGNILKLSYPEHPLLEIPIGAGRVGGIATGGLNPVAALIENGIEVDSHAVSDLADFSTLFHYSALPQRIKEVL
jgi:repressor of nif and glnA expression